MDQNLDNIQNVLSRFVRLSHTSSHIPQIVFPNDPLEKPDQDVAAPWSWTAAEAATTEAVLFPFLIHLAAAQDDIDSMNYCLETASGGIGSHIDPASGRTPLHVAAVNGHVRSVNTLLRSGALVHLRDNLGHTALYYVRAF